MDNPGGRRDELTQCKVDFRTSSYTEPCSQTTTMMPPLVPSLYPVRFPLGHILNEIQRDNPRRTRDESTQGKVDFSTL
jgi:hypothetical protein